ncbi:MAG: DUF6473 family protein [Paracoccaceae bacterium]
MRMDRVGEAPPYWTPCRYGTSRLAFRGPAVRADGGHLAALGGAATFGRFLRRSGPGLLGEALGAPVVNLGVPGAGLEAMEADGAIRAIAHDAAGVLIEAPPPQTGSGHWLRVHPRRNDRVLAPGPALRALYPETDLVECAFAGALLARLRRTCPRRFARLSAGLRADWRARMSALVAGLPGEAAIWWRPAEAARWPVPLTPADLRATGARVIALPRLRSARARVRTMCLGPADLHLAVGAPGAAERDDWVRATAPLARAWLSRR